MNDRHRGDQGGGKGADRFERNVFLAHGGNPAGIHGVPALIHPAHGTSKTETCTYRAPAGNITRTYTFVDGKQKTTLDTRTLKVPPPS